MNIKENKIQHSYNTQMQEYQMNRATYATSKNIEQFNEFNARRPSNTDLSSSQSALYSLSQRIQQPVNTSCSSLCDGGSGQYKEEMCGVENNPEEKTTTSSGMISNSTNNNKCDNDTIQFQEPVIPTCVYLHNKTAIMMEIEDTPTATVDLICQAIINCDELGLNKHVASQVFTIWMVSPLLELQLKRYQKPYEIRKTWRYLVETYSHASYNRQERDEPKMMFQRNVFYPLNMEEKIKDSRTLELLYEEAKNNIINGRYPCEVAHYIMLGGVQAHIELGPYNPQVHSTHFFREEQHKYLPMHVRKSATWAWLPISYKNSPEVRLLEHYKRVPTSATNKKLMKKYLEFCWTLPFYGSAFFEAQIEQPVRGLSSLITYHDLPVLIAVNSTSIYVIDDIECVVLLGLRYEDMSWEYAKPSKEDDPNCLPCLFIQFTIVENGARVSKILQIFSRQAYLMDGLITQFVNRFKQQKNNDEIDNRDPSNSALIYTNSSQTINSLSNKLGRLTLATFDENGHCIGQMGSWKFNY